MRLSAIKLAGFKSFVDPTTLALASNLTGVVGPNGCGKSNVIDAVRWVTGESSARQLRGEALEDVIFNGSHARKPIGRAAVELRFDNSEGKLGGQYAAFSEISVRRELVRDGGSRYFINGTRARRRDVIDLFLGTGLGGRSNYAVIEQGAVNRLIEAKPEDMRQVLEEAAGISKYKERRRETENRMRHTRDNLERLDDLIGEVSQRLGVLKRQAANAEKYKQLKADERRLRVELLALRWVAQDSQVEAAEAGLRECEGALRDAVSAQREAQAGRDEVQKIQQTAMEAVQTCQGAFYDAQSQAARIAQSLAHARELREVKVRERDELTRRLDNLDARAAEDRVAEEQSTAEQTESGRAREQASAAADEARAAMVQAERSADQAEAAWDALNSAEQNPVQQLDAERRRAGYAEERLAQLNERHVQRTDERMALGAAEDTELAAAERALAARAERLEADQQAALRTGEEDEALRQAIAEAEREVSARRTALGEHQAALASEKKLQQAVLREDDAAIAQWLERVDRAGAPGVARRVAVRPEWQTAAEAVLGSWLRGFLVATLPQIDGDFPADPLSLVEDHAEAGPAAAGPGPGGLPSLADGLEAPAAIRAAAARVYVADDMPRALAVRDRLAPDQQLVTLDGCRIGRHSLVTPVGEAAETGVLEREKRIAALTATVAQDEQDYAVRVQALEAYRDEQRAVRERRLTLDRTIGETRRALEAERAELEGRRLRAEQRARRRNELDQELAELAAQADDAAREAHDAGERLGALQEAAETFSANRRSAQAELAEARAERDRARSALDRAQSALRQIDSRIEQIASRREGISERLADTVNARADVAQRLAAFDADTEAPAAAAPDEAEYQRALEAQARAERELRAARGRLAETEKAQQADGQRLMSTEQDLEAARENLQQAKIDVERAAVRRAGVGEQLEELGEDPATRVEHLPEHADIDRWGADIETIERKIQRLGAINLAAIDEYDSEFEREAYLQSQHADLSQALATLETAIAKIDRETRARFKSTYEQVNARFSHMFPDLFGGGEAALELTEDDWLATGIRVMARPPGKRNASIQMLSGGEKALTAVALLFALFELNPAPFCMLDEIDAPLDDANVSRFCELVRRMSTQVQFIVITHNKLTMELAEQLHGVTMAEPGVSRLVSVDIDQALDLAG